MHWLSGQFQLSTEKLSERLVTKTDAEYREFIMNNFNYTHQVAGFGGGVRTRGYHQLVELEIKNSLPVNFIIFQHHDLLAKLAEIILQVEGEGVVVVDEEKHG